MTASNTHKEQMFIGIDGGGTKCRATLFSNIKGVLGVGLSGPANPLHGFDRTLESISVASQLALKDANLDYHTINEIVAGVGLAGVNLPSLYQQMQDWQHPFKTMHLTTDLHTACIGAHDGQDGAVIITGTGSCGFALVGGESTLLGGHGFSQGDKGSGAWFGLEAVKAALLSIDGLGPKTCLAEHLLNFFEVNNAMGIAEKMAGKPSSTYAQLAPIVLEAASHDDEAAKIIVNEGASYINQLAFKLLDKNPPRLSMIGGLSEPLQPWLSKDVVQYINPAIHAPEMGAVLFAQQLNENNNASH